MMNSVERVTAVIRRQPFDRLPVYGWLRSNLEKQLTAAFGSVEAFEDRYEFDMAHLFPQFPAFSADVLKEARERKGSALSPEDLLDLPMTDADDQAGYRLLADQISFYGKDRGRFTYVQTPGIFEPVNNYLGLENHMMCMALEPDRMMEIYGKQAAWNRRFAMNAIDLGINMVHVSDDWGGQTSLLFSMDMWKRMIAPFHRIMADAVKGRGCFLSLHSDGNVMQVLDEFSRMGYDVLHPFQESAGMDYRVYLDRYAGSFTVLGGIDIQTTLGFGRLDLLQAEIERVVGLFGERGILMCTSHFVQDHCSVEELVFAYDLIHRLVRKAP
jgi:uroporphyrinogen decarboxylase